MSILSLPSTTDDAILDNLSAAELFKYARTCRTIHAVVQAYLRRAFQVHKLLAQYFTPSETVQFRRLQAATGMLISGSTALQFFDRVVYPGSDLDLYVAHAAREEVGRWLLSIGYRYVPQKVVLRAGGGASATLNTFDDALARLPLWTPLYDPWLGHEFLHQGGDGYIGAGCLFSFVKTNPDRKIEIISSMKSPLERILNFHSTCVMNIITHDKAYSFFPRASFIERRSLVCARPKLDALAHKKYSDRGWTVMYSLPREEFDDLHSPFVRGARRVGDTRCWTLPVFPRLSLDLDLEESHASRQARGGQYMIEANTWDMQYNRALRPKMRYFFVNSVKLCFTYLVDSEDIHLRLHIASILNKPKLVREEPSDRRDITQESSSSADHTFLDAKFAAFLKWYHSSNHHISDTCPFSSAMVRRKRQEALSIPTSQQFAELAFDSTFARLDLA